MHTHSHGHSLKRIHLFAGDRFPSAFHVQIFDHDAGIPLDVSGEGIVVMFHFRNEGHHGRTIFSNPCDLVLPELGIVKINPPAMPLNACLGYYDGIFTVHHTADGLMQTVHDRLRFLVEEGIRSNSIPMQMKLAGLMIRDGELWMQNKDNPKLWHRVTAGGAADAAFLNIENGEEIGVKI